MCSPNNISSRPSQTDPTVLSRYFSNIPSASRCSDRLLASIITLGAVVRTTFGNESRKDLDLKFEKNVVNFTFCRTTSTYQPNINEAINTFAEDCQYLSQELLEESHNLVEIGLAPPNPIDLAIDTQDFTNALTRILEPNSTKLRLLGAKIWLAFAYTEAGEKTKMLIIRHFPSILPSADLFIRTQLSTAMPFLPDEVRRKLFIKDKSCKKIALITLDILHQMDENAAKIFWLQHMETCSSIEYASHPIGRQHQAESLMEHTIHHPDPRLGLKHIKAYCLTDHIRYIPALLGKIQAESRLENDVLNEINPLIQLMEKMVGKPVLPDSISLSCNEQLRTSQEYIDEVVDSLFGLRKFKHPLSKCGYSDESYTIDPLDHISSCELSPELVFALTTSFARDQKFQNELANLFIVANKNEYPDPIKDNIIFKLYNVALSHTNCLKLIHCFKPKNEDPDAEKYYKPFYTALHVSIKNTRHKMSFHAAIGKELAEFKIHYPATPE